MIIKRAYIKQDPANTLPSDHSEGQYQKAVVAFKLAILDRNRWRSLIAIVGDP